MSKIHLPESAKYLLFDMDGTLVDTEPIGPANFLEQLRKYGVTPDPSEYDLFIKVWRREGTDINEETYLADIVNKYGIDKTPKQYINEFFDMYEQALVKAKALPGVDDFLAKVSGDEKFKLAIVTASKLSQVNAVLDEHDWREVFDVIISEEDITKHKPDPEPFRVAMYRLGAAPEESVVFEDSKNGSLAGKASGAYVIGLTVGNSQPQDLSSASIVAASFIDFM